MITTTEKYSIVILVIAIAVVGVVAYVFPSFFNEGQFALNNIERYLPKVECNYGGDQKTYQAALDNREVGICSCIGEERIKEMCVRVTQDLALYGQAISQSNPDICNEITGEERREACFDMSQSRINYLRENNLQALADDYLFAHSDKAIGELENLIEENPDDSYNLLQLALAYAEKGLSEQEQGNDQAPYVEKALAMIERAKQINPEDSEVYSAEGYVYEIQPNFAKAIESYNRAIELDPNNYSAYAGRGHVNSMIGLLDQALSDLKIAAKLDKDNQDIHIYANLCRLEASRSDLYIDAIKNCQISIESESQDIVFKSEAYQILATIFSKNNDYFQTESYLLKAKTLTPQDPNLFVALANLYMNTGNYVKAEVNAKESIRISSTKADAYQTLAYSLYKQEKYQEAIEKANIGLDLVDNDVSLLEPNKPVMYQDLYYTLANIYNKLGDEANELKYKELGDNALLIN